MLASARGTRAFKAPEAFQDPQKDSCAGDVWALGCTLYLLLCDRLPYAEAGEVDSIDPSQFQRPSIPPSRLNTHVDPTLDQIIFRALAIDVKQRYPTANEFLEDLMRWKPRAVQGLAKPKASLDSDASKSALGMHSPLNEAEALKMAARAMKLARESGKQVEAADLMEEAFNLSPSLRAKYEYQLQLWRRGLAM